MTDSQELLNSVIQHEDKNESFNSSIDGNCFKFLVDNLIENGYKYIASNTVCSKADSQ